MVPRILLLPAVIALIGAGLFISLRSSNDGPFEGKAFRYDIERFKASDAGLLSWSEVLNIPLGAGEPHGLAADGKGGIFVAAGNKLLVLDEEGRPVREETLTTPAVAVAVGPGGEVYLSVGDSIEVHSREGAVKRWASLGEKAIITSLAAGGDDVFAADAGHRIVWRFDRDGRLLGSFGRKNLARRRLGFVVPSPYFDLALAGDNALWVVNPGRLRIERHEYDGRLAGFWGEASLAVTGFGGCCNPSHIAFLPDGSFVTSEKGLPRVKVYGPGGRLRSVVAGPESFRPGTVGLDLAVDSAGRVLVLDPSRRELRVFQRNAAAGEKVHGKT